MIRPLETGDIPFVRSGWSASYRMSRDLAFVQMSNYADVMHPIVDAVLARPNTEVLIDAGAVLRGFIVFERPDYVIYVYVAQPFRRNGIARDLMLAAGIDPRGSYAYAARTRASWQLQLNGKMPCATFDPMRVRFGKEDREQRNKDR